MVRSYSLWIPCILFLVLRSFCSVVDIIEIIEAKKWSPVWVCVWLQMWVLFECSILIRMNVVVLLCGHCIFEWVQFALGSLGNLKCFHLRIEFQKILTFEQSHKIRNMQAPHSRQTKICFIVMWISCINSQFFSHLIVLTLDGCVWVYTRSREQYIRCLVTLLNGHKHAHWASRNSLHYSKQ